MEENAVNNIAVQEADTTGEVNNVSEGKSKRAFEKFKSRFVSLLSPERRKKTIIVTAVAAVIIIFLCVFFTLTNPKNIAKRYTKAVITGNEKAVSRLLAYDNEEVWLSNSGLYYLDSYVKVERFFEKQSDIYEADIDSWNDFYKAYKRYCRDGLEDEYGKYKISVKVRRSNSISKNKLITSGEFGSLSEVEKYGFDSSKASAYKKVTVSWKISGEDGTSRDTWDVYLAKVNGFWKVL